MRGRSGQMATGYYRRDERERGSQLNEGRRLRNAGGACAGDGMATDRASAPLLPSGAGTGQGGGTFSAYFTLEIHCVLLVELVLITTTVVK